MQLLAWIVAIAASYLLGSVSFAVVVSRLFGLADPRSYGSGNPGATNVLRSGSKAAAALTLLGDAAKGAVAVWLVRALGPQFGVGELGVALAALAAFVGHLYPIFFGFKGGKGVATFLGALLALNFGGGLLACATWLAVAAAFRYSSLSSLCAALLAPLALLWLTGAADLSLVVAAMSALLILRHRQNIANLLAGRERRIGEKSPG
ncbi:MAG: glycerol-3-phosphate 1-O-acyltransferase PlsY [Burkholderiales bacterium]|nr:MAG: glycerol-3-phosphate 1-O-acyltransferase PlsY [Burkholderiales bacterium]